MLKARGKLATFAKIAATATVVCTIALVATACAGNAAATVNGKAISEDKITNYIQSFRTTNGLAEEDAWAQWLSTNSMTAETARSEAIDYFVRLEVIDEAAKEKGIEVSDEEVAAKIAEIKENAGFDDAQFQEELDAVGYTVESYNEYIMQSIQQEKLMDALSQEYEVTDDQILEEGNSYSDVLNGAKEVEVIEVADKAQAKEALKKMKEGASFDDIQGEIAAVSVYDGWDIFNQFDSKVQKMIGATDMGAASKIVKGSDGNYFAINVVSVLEVGKKGFKSLDKIPESMKEQLISNIKYSYNMTAFDDFIKEHMDAADIVIADMPSGLPYDVEVPESEDDVHFYEESESVELDAGSADNGDSGEGEDIVIDEEVVEE